MSGWTKAVLAGLLALSSAVFLNLAMPGVTGMSGWWPLLLICLCPLLLTAELRPAQAMTAGFVFGLAAYSGHYSPDCWLHHLPGRPDCGG